MPKATKAQLEAELARISGLLAENKAGASRKAIAAAYKRQFGKSVPSRTFQRWLEKLVDRADAIKEGDGPSTIYKPVDERAAIQSAGYPPLTAPAENARARIRRPLSERTPIGYDRDWLFAYKPGVTSYLPTKVRKHLMTVGLTTHAQRPAGTFARDILGRLLIDLAWASSKLEGNTYTRLDTQNLLEFGQRADGKDAREAQMILNHKAAIELLVSDSQQMGFNRPTISAIHAALSENLLADPSDEGRLRERPVSITGTTYTPTAIPQVIQECFGQIVSVGSQINDPFECAFFVMVHIPYLQPFVDVNKRTSRLAANIPLIAANVCPLSFVDVPEDAYVEGTLSIYEDKRTELLRDVFVFAYERSSAQYRVVRDSLGEPDPVRLRYRTQLADVVAETVREGAPPRLDSLSRKGSGLGIPEGDLNAFSEVALKILVGLHEGSAVRYGLRPSEFLAWKRRFDPAGSS